VSKNQRMASSRTDVPADADARTQVHVHSHRVRFRECDPMGVVYHTHCIDWFEEARTEALRSMGASYLELGMDMPVVDLAVSYRRAIRYDELVDIRVTWSLNRTSTRIRFDYEVVRQGHDGVCITAHVVLCFMDRDRGRPVSAPPRLVALIAGPDA